MEEQTCTKDKGDNQGFAVSCIVPVYNVEKYLEEFLESLVNQTFQNVEIICVDDASTDSSRSILESYKKKYGMTIIYNDKNVGAAESRNRGLRVATGEYVIFLDSDDIMDLTMLEDMYHNCKKYEADIGVCYAVKFSGETYTQLGFRERDKKLIPTYPVIYNPLNFEKVFQIITNSPTDKMVRRKLLVDNEIEFQQLPCSNDVFYSYASMLSASKIVYIDKILYYIRENRGGSITLTWKGKNFICEAKDKIYDFMQLKGIYKAVEARFIDATLKEIYNWLTYYSEDYLEETIERLKTFYLPKWGVLEKFSNGALLPISWQIVNNIMCKKKMESYNVIILNVFYSKMVSLVELLQKQNKKIVWWGCGKNGRNFLHYFHEHELKIDFVVDNDLDKQGQVFEIYEINDWDSVKESAGIIFVITDAWIDDIRKQTGGVVPILNIVEYLDR